MRSIYDGVLSKISVRPQSASAGAVNGSGVDTKGYNSGMAIIEVGAASGSPTAQTVDAKIQESDDNATWTDVSGATITQITADNKSAQIRVEGLGTNRKRYLRVVTTVGFTGGTSPAIPVSAHIVLGRAYKEPVGNSSVGA